MLSRIKNHWLEYLLGFILLGLTIFIFVGAYFATTQGSGQANKAEKMCTAHCNFFESNMDWVKPHSSCTINPNAWDCQYVCMCYNGEYKMFNLSDHGLTEEEEDDTVE